MPFELFLALRYLRSRRRHALARITALAAIAGIAVGVGALIVALALANGFKDELQEKILRGTAQLTVMRRDGGPIPDWAPLKSRLQNIADVKSAAASSYSGALLTTSNGSAEYAVLRGLDPDSREEVETVRKLVIAGEMERLLAPSPATCTPTAAAGPALIGAELAQRLDLRIGDQIELTSGPGLPDPDASGLNINSRRALIVGTFRTGLYEYDATWVYLPLWVITCDRSGPSVISVQAADPYLTPRIATDIRAQLGPGYTTIDWQQANGPLFAALALERKAGAVIIGLIILIAALNITTTLVLVVVERRVDIAILNAMGARGSSIMAIFMIEGAFIGLAGALIGVLIGLGACYLGTRFHWVSLPSDVYSISSVPFHPQLRDVLMAALAAFGLSLISTIYPARAAARVRPAETLRDGG